MAITSIRFEAIGDHIEIKIGAHCRASLTTVEEELLWEWLTRRVAEREALELQITLDANPSSHYLDLLARNGA